MYICCCWIRICSSIIRTFYEESVAESLFAEKGGGLINGIWPIGGYIEGIGGMGGREDEVGGVCGLRSGGMGTEVP